MNFKLAILAAAAVGAATTAQAADLAKKAPAAANYVKVCDAYGAGFFYIPGSETCLKIGGYVRVDLQGGGGDLGFTNYGSDRNQHNMTTQARAEVDFDARTATEFGLLRSFIALRVDAASGGLGSGAQSAYVDKAYIQFGGLTAGNAESFFDFFTGASVGWLEPNWSDETTNLLAYTFSFGNGISATLSIEDPTKSRRVGGASGSVSYYGGMKTPDVVGNVRIDQAWGSAQVMAAYHDNYSAYSLYGNEAGWAAGAGVKVNLPMLGASDYVVLQGAYGKGALNYVTVNAGSFGIRDFYGVGTGIDQTTAWQISGGFHHDFTKTVAFNFDAGYFAAEAPSNQFEDFKSLALSADVTWTPVAGLAIIPHASYISNDKVWDSVASKYDEENSWVVGLRIQRNF